MIYKSVVVGRSSLPHGGLLKSLALLLINFAHAFSGHLSGFGVGHAENIICLDSSILSAVTGNWLTKLLDFLGWSLSLDSVESSLSFRGILLLLFDDGLGAKVHDIIILSPDGGTLLIDCVLWYISAEEGVHLSWWNGLK